MLTTRQFAARHAEFARRGVAIVRLFRSPSEALAPFASGPSALPYQVLADPGRVACRAYGVGRSWRALLSLAPLARIREARALGLRPRFRDAWRDGVGGCPADFLIGADGRIERAHYGAHLADSIAPAEALAWIDAAPALG